MADDVEGKSQPVDGGARIEQWETLGIKRVQSEFRCYAPRLQWVKIKRTFR
jgi:hypothetical protein